MSLEVFLHPSTTSPPPEAFEAAMDAALAIIGAARDDDGEGITLADGSTFDLYLDDEDDIALLTLSTVNDALSDAVYALMAQTRSFLLSEGFVCRIPETGEIIPSLAMGFPQVRVLGNRADLREILDSAVLASEDMIETSDENADYPVSDADLEAAALAAAPPPDAEPVVSRPGKPLLQRLSDALFGKSI